MDYLDCFTKGSPDHQLHSTEMVLQDIKDIFTSVPFELKDSLSLIRIKNEMVTGQ